MIPKNIPYCTTAYNKLKYLNKTNYWNPRYNVRFNDIVICTDGSRE